MKKTISLLLCLLLCCSATACKREEEQTESTEPTNTQQEEVSSKFLSMQERMEWTDLIVSTLSANDCYEEREYGCFGAALMDLDQDNTPELFLAYTGGSMGNVCMMVYDLLSGEQLCVLGETPHYENWNNVYFCMYQASNGSYLPVNKGVLRNGLTFYHITSILNGQFKTVSWFEEAQTLEEETRYFCNGEELDKAEFEQRQALFYAEHTECKETQMQIVYWDDLATEAKGEALLAMANALVKSEQQFLRFAA